MAPKCMMRNISATVRDVTWHQQTTNRKGPSAVPMVT